MRIRTDDILGYEKRFRANLINSVSGFKSKTDRTPIDQSPPEACCDCVRAGIMFRSELPSLDLSNQIESRF